MSKEKTAEIKRRLNEGETVPGIAAKDGLPYMTVYRVSEHRRGTKEKITNEIRSWILSVKKRKQWTNTRIAAKIGVTSVTIARVLEEDRSILAARCQAMLLSSGNNVAARAKYGLSRAEIAVLLEEHKVKPLSPRAKAILEQEE